MPEVLSITELNRLNLWNPRRCRAQVAAFCVIALAIVGQGHPAEAQNIKKLTVEITTGDVTFAGTDDPVQLNIGGHSFQLDNPNRDDFERNRTDTFELELPGPGLDLTVLSQLEPMLSIVKLQDSFFGGGWNLRGVKISDQNANTIYSNSTISKWLSGSPDNIWSASATDAGWTLPQPPPPWPPCEIVNVEFGGRFVDSDCDGTPDQSDTSFDQPPDSDGDGLPDAYEDQNGFDPNNPDVDNDGWTDGRKNIRLVLVLTTIEALDVDDWVGNDEVYVVGEDVAFPARYDLDGYWSIAEGARVPVNQIVDSRVASGLNAAPGPGHYSSRILLRSKDVQVAEWLSQWPPTDRTFIRETVRWPSPDPIIVEHENGGHYRLTFKTITTTFADPTPRDNPNAVPPIVGALGDVDHDMLSERLEAKISAQTVEVNVNGQVFKAPVTEGYDGLADPEYRDMFVEIDSSGADYRISPESIQKSASQYFYHGIRPRLDMGYLGGGGQILPYEEDFPSDFRLTSKFGTFKGNPSNFSPARGSFFRYGLSVDTIDGNFFRNGKAACNGRSPPCQDFMIARQIMIADFGAIVLFHEIGHTLRLCHPVGKDNDNPPHPYPTCPAPVGWGSNGAECDYCGVGDDDVTAMGDDVDWFVIAVVGVGVVGAVIVGAIFGGVLGAIGAGVGAVILGTILGSLFSDPIQREVNYHPHEWERVQLFSDVRDAH